MTFFVLDDGPGATISISYCSQRDNNDDSGVRHDSQSQSQSQSQAQMQEEDNENDEIFECCLRLGICRLFSRCWDMNLVSLVSLRRDESRETTLRDLA